jgi:hypothetical protein
MSVERGPLSPVSIIEDITEELMGRKSSGLSIKPRIRHKDPSR